MSNTSAATVATPATSTATDLMDVLAEVYEMRAGAVVEFVSGATVAKIGRTFQVTDKHGKVYSSLGRDHAAMIANAGE